MKKLFIFLFPCWALSAQADSLTGADILTLYGISQNVTVQVSPGVDSTHLMLLVKYDQLINGVSVRKCFYQDGTALLATLSNKGDVTLFSLIMGGFPWNDPWCTQ
jgi:hypothetical protein